MHVGDAVEQLAMALQVLADTLDAVPALLQQILLQARFDLLHRVDAVRVQLEPELAQLRFDRRARAGTAGDVTQAAGVDVRLAGAQRLP